MSILLDALRRSEAQRRLGETPTLQTPVASGNGSSDGRRYWFPVLLVVLTAALITWIGMAQFRTVPARQQTSMTTTPGEPGQNQAEVTADSTGSLPEETTGKPASTPVKDFAAPDRTPVSAASPGQPPAANLESPLNLPGQSPVVIAPPQEPAQLGSDVATDTLPAAEAVVPKRSGEGSDRLEPYVSEPLSYWQMPQSLRDSMPPLHITVLVYAEKPSDRFLLINGERLHEKEMLGDGLVLEEIQRDRAIFTYRNYRFQVKG